MSPIASLAVMYFSSWQSHLGSSIRRIYQSLYNCSNVIPPRPPNIIGSEGRNIYGRLKEAEDLTGSTVVPKELSPVFNKAEAMTGGAAITTAAVGGISLREMHSSTTGNSR